MVSQADQILIDELRKRIEGVAPEQLKDYVLMLYLRACKMDVVRAAVMLNKFLDAKQELGNWERNRMNFRDYNPPKHLAEDLHYKYLGTDDEGRLVYWLPVGRWNFRHHFENGLADELFLHFFKCVDEGMHQLYKEGERTGTHKKVVIIADFDGLTFSKIANYEFLRKMFGLLGTFQSFGNLMEKFYMVNGSWVTTYVRKLAAPFLSKKTNGKIVQLSSKEKEWKEVLRESVPLQDLPEEYGGKGVKMLG